MSAPALPYGFARTQGVLVIAQDQDSAEILLREGADVNVVSEVRRHIGVPLRVVGSIGRSGFEARLAEMYGQGENDAAEVVQDLGQDVDILKLMQELPAVEDLLDSQDDAPIIRLINALFTQAVHERASDIHVEPFEQHSIVRFRRDGMLRDVAQPHRGLHAAMSSRIKIMASLDIAERRLPQDGRIALRIGNRAVDVRVSTIPTMHGERLVLRLLEKDAARLQLAALGMPDDIRTALSELLGRPHGIVLITGPTGSGKTTTLYAALHTLDRKSRNIVTVEDPVEYDVAGVGQVQVNSRIELSFARALRAILRQDPDVIMIGEIRDLETAEIAVQASLTGHLVLATLHTNDAAAAVTRLVDMGVESFLLASSLRGVLAQRLVRCLCPLCKQAKAANAADKALLGAACPATLWSPVGCSKCNQTGYAGRTGVYELLLADDELIKLIHDGASEASLRAHGRKSGSRSLREDGIRLIADGTTSVEELLRVSGEA
ncbi:MAG: type II secretion system ATPase GspE [Rhodocyclaceae bacterium]|nr:type II secretion system ATPase GspE [Rhodocyclaceae bacterium]MBK9624864.1 type II secretion system ATPase GspE [Rhodocyclaceae bacterium]MBL0076351.1 type II secretion system ATPase GspE [Rhodocyclaceae bacterium]MBP7080544.1 type II secretion system ATPase GspE [Rhodocyclaceae bacterium]